MFLCSSSLPLQAISSAVYIRSCISKSISARLVSTARSSRPVPHQRTNTPRSPSTPPPHRRRLLCLDIRSRRREFSVTRRAKMSDEDYLAFLEKANKKPSEGGAAEAKTEGAKQGFKATSEGAEVPKILREAVKNQWYSSDADEMFEGVSLGLPGGGDSLPDEEEFAKLIGHWDPKNAEVEILDPVDWDANGQYNSVVDAVREAGEGGDVRVYKVSRGDSVRYEYWVITVKGGKVVGAKVLAVES